MFRQLLLSVAWLALMASSARAQGLDQVFTKGAPPTRGTIVAMGRDEVSIESSGAQRPFAVNEILRITFGDEPSELSGARNAVMQKNYNQALTELKKLDGQRPTRDLIKHDIDFYKALSQAKLAMTEGGDKAAATTAMLNFAKSAPQSYHFYAAAEVLGDLAMASGKFADAERFYTPLAAAPWGDYKMRANNTIGRALIAQKKFPEALQKFEEVAKSELASPEAAQQKLVAATGKAVCLAETGQADAGIALLQDIIAKNDPADAALFARAYNALGQCYLKANRPKDALQAFLHTDVLFYAEPEAHAESLYYLSKLWNDVNKADRAVAARNTLRERYAGSVWAATE
jgi:tetratricopeptide (TPR) repeat protein